MPKALSSFVEDPGHATGSLTLQLMPWALRSFAEDQGRAMGLCLAPEVDSVQLRFRASYELHSSC